MKLFKKDVIKRKNKNKENLVFQISKRTKALPPKIIYQIATFQ